MAETAMKRYSLTFKQEVVREYEGGASVAELMRKYGITGHQTIRTWIKHHSRKGARTVTREINDPQTQAELESLKAKVDSLEHAPFF